MKGITEYPKHLYVGGEYIHNNPSAHEEDSPWKISKLTLFVDKFMNISNKKEINLLDVGGGAGLILSGISDYIKNNYNVKVNKSALELSPDMLEIQRKNNADLDKVLNEDIRETSLADKAMDLILLIDLLEHIYDPVEALREASRVSKFAILKVPLENNLFLKVLNFLSHERQRQYTIETFGHINIYNLNTLKLQIEEYMGRILHVNFTNTYDYFLSSEVYRNNMNFKNKLVCFIAKCTYALSPKLCSLIFGDFVILLIKCY